MIKKIRVYIFLIGLCICLPKIFFSQILYPTDISGIVGWYSSDSIVSTNGTQILNWNDVSGHNNHLTQTSVLNQGTFYTNQLNSKPCIRLDGVNSFYSFTDSVDFRTIIIVGKANEAVFSDYRGLFGGPLSSLSIGGYLINGIGGSSNLGQGGSTSIFSQMLKNNISTLPSADFSPLNNYWVGNFEFTTNRKQTSDFGRIDNGNQPGRYWLGDIFEIIIYNKTLSSTESNDIFNYLSQKYAPSVILPPDITVSNSLCDTVITINSHFESYSWSTGATTPTISVNQTGKYWVTATNVFGKISSDTILVAYPGHFLSQNATLCFGDSIVWNTNLPKSQYTFQWQDNSPDSVFTIKQAGQYFVKVVDGNGCSVNTNTITITQDNFSTIASLGPDINLCSGNLITLTSGSSPSLTYTWSTGSNNDSLLITVSGQYSVAVTNTNNCVAIDTISITVLGQAPVANFTTSVGCQHTGVLFTNLSSPSIGSTITVNNWDFGDPLSAASNSSTATNPFHTFSDTGTYVVKLNVISNTTCEQTIIKTIHIAPTPTVNFLYGGVACQNDSTSFAGSITNVPTYTTTAIHWNFGDAASGPANSSIKINPKHLFSNQLIYGVKFIATNSAGCKDSIIKNINVQAQVKASFTYSAACTNELIKFYDNSIVPPPNSTNTRNWNINGSTPSGTLVSHSFPSAGVYPVTLTVNGNNGCSSTTVKQVTVTIPPAGNFASPLNFCISDSIRLIDASSGNSVAIQSWRWNIDNIFYSSIQSPYLKLLSAGNHTVGLSVVDGYGCKDSLTKSVFVYPLPVVDFTTSPNYIFTNTSATLTPNITNAQTYNWTGTNSFNSSTAFPTYQFGDTGKYQITLFLTDINGCKNSKVKTITVNNRITDLAILNIIPIVQSDGFLDLTAYLGNLGTTVITDFKISYKLTNGGQIQEIWNGTLNSGSLFNYHFAGASLADDENRNSIICVTISQINGANDDNIQNNNECLALYAVDNDVLLPYPNPSTSSIIFPIVLKKNTDILYTITNALGSSIIENTTINGTAGLNLIPISLSNLSSGCYFIKITIDDKIFIKKIIKE